MIIAVNAFLGFLYGHYAPEVGLGRITNVRWWIGLLIMAFLLVVGEKLLGL